MLTVCLSRLSGVFAVMKPAGITSAKLGDRIRDDLLKGLFLKIVLFFFLLFAVCTPHAEYYVYCFGGVCAAASTILVVAIAKFGSYDKNRDTKQHARLIIILFNFW